MLEAAKRMMAREVAAYAMMPVALAACEQKPGVDWQAVDYGVCAYNCDAPTPDTAATEARK